MELKKLQQAVKTSLQQDQSINAGLQSALSELARLKASLGKASALIGSNRKLISEDKD